MPLDFSYLNQFQRVQPSVDPVAVYQQAKDAALVRKANEADFQYKRELLKNQVDNANLAKSQAAEDAADQERLNGIYRDVYGTEGQTPEQIDSAVLNAAASQLRPRNFLKLQTGMASVAKDRAAMTKDMLPIVQDQNARMANLADQAAGLSDEARAAAWPELVKQARAIDPNAQVPDQPPTADMLKLWGSHFSTQAQAAKARLDALEADLKKAQTGQANASAAHSAAETANTQAQLPGIQAVAQFQSEHGGLKPAEQIQADQALLTGDQKDYDRLVKDGTIDPKKTSLLDYQKTMANLKQPTTNVNVGTFQLAEDANGKPVLFNTKTGEVRDASGMQKSGTQAKEDAKTAPLKDAVSYGQDYLDGKTYTGPGDEALLEKFFELAKPSSGFRMTQAQMDMLSHSRGILGSAAANIHHALYGTWFTDKQRAEIVDTMKSIAKSKGLAESGSVDPDVKAYADQYFGGDIKKAQEAIANQK